MGHGSAGDPRWDVDSNEPASDDPEPFTFMGSQYMRSFHPERPASVGKSFQRTEHDIKRGFIGDGIIAKARSSEPRYVLNENPTWEALCDDEQHFEP